MARRVADSDLLVDLGKRLRVVRKAAGLSQASLAERTGLAVSTVSLMETGKMAYTVTTAHALADACGVTLAALVGGEVTQPRTNAARIAR